MRVVGRPARTPRHTKIIMSKPERVRFHHHTQGIDWEELVQLFKSAQLDGRQGDNGGRDQGNFCRIHGLSGSSRRPFRPVY